MKTLCAWFEYVELSLIRIMGISILLLLPVSGSGAVPTTRQQTILPVAIPDGTPEIAPSNVPLYEVYGYSAWEVGGGTNEGRKFDLMPDGYTGSRNMARLLSFFTISDIHITDKESPAQVPYLGWSAEFGDPGLGDLNPSAYSPIILDTTHRLNAAVKTINAMHQQANFACGIAIGDMCNASQFNELRWFMQVMDGEWIVPSSGDHLGADTIDYQIPYQADGLDPSIPWYAVIGNHDQMWMGIGYPSAKIKQALTGSNVLNISTNGPLIPPGSDGVGMYVGVVDGATPYGSVIKWGLTNLFDTSPTVAADPDRRSLTTSLDSPTNFINAFFDTTTLPKGHGFTLGATGVLASCYSFEPLADMPIKVIMLDDTCKVDQPDQSAMFYGDGWVDAVRYTWLTNELQMGQDADQLMIIACHVPILPQAGLTDTNRVAMFYDTASESNLVATLHNYPNLLMVMAGHRHLSVVTPFPSPDPARPECGFWEVETPSLRDFSQQFRTWDIRRNSDNSISILTTCVDPEVETNTPAWKSLGYGVAVERVFGRQALDDTSSHTYNAELVKQLTPAMQAKIANYGSPLSHGGNDYDGDGVSELAVFDNTAANWYAYGLQTGQTSVWAQQWGWAGALTVPGDYDADGVDDLAVFNSATGEWYIRSASGSSVIVWGAQWGWAGTVPVPGDYDGDGASDLAVFDEDSAYWYILSAEGTPIAMQVPWGWAGALSVPGDYDGDGVDDLAVFNSATGEWYIRSVSGSSLIAWAVSWGWAGAVPVPGDYDGDGVDDLAVFNSATGEWYIRSVSGSSLIAWAVPWGWAGAVPVSGDYDGDGYRDLAVFNASTGSWYIGSLAGDVLTWGSSWGGSDMTPVGAAY